MPGGWAVPRDVVARSRGTQTGEGKRLISVSRFTLSNKVPRQVGLFTSAFESIGILQQKVAMFFDDLTRSRSSSTVGRN